MAKKKAKMKKVKAHPDARVGRYFRKPTPTGHAKRWLKNPLRTVYVFGDWTCREDGAIVSHACLQIVPEIRPCTILFIDPEKWVEVTEEFSTADRDQHKKDWRRLTNEALVKRRRASAKMRKPKK